MKTFGENIIVLYLRRLHRLPRRRHRHRHHRQPFRAPLTKHRKGTRASQTHAILIKGRLLPAVQTSATLNKAATCRLLWPCSVPKWMMHTETPLSLLLRSATRTPVAAVLLQARQRICQASEGVQPSLAYRFQTGSASNSSARA